MKRVDRLHYNFLVGLGEFPESEKTEKIRDFAYDLVDEIIEKYIETKENLDNKTSNKQFSSGIQAIQAFGELENVLINWSYSHLYDCFTRYETLNKPHDFNWNHPENYAFIKKNSLYDDSSYLISAPSLSYQAFRDYLACIFSHKSQRIPKQITKDFYSELDNALVALNYGEVREVFQPCNKGYQRNKIALDFFRWLAVLHVWKHRGFHFKSIEKAREFVAEKLNVTPDSLKSWEKRISKHHEKNKQKKFTKIYGEFLKHSERNEHDILITWRNGLAHDAPANYHSYVKYCKAHRLHRIQQDRLNYSDLLDTTDRILNAYHLDKLKELMYTARQAGCKVTLIENGNVLYPLVRIDN